jgi:hypothetical protein
MSANASPALDLVGAIPRPSGHVACVESAESIIAGFCSVFSAGCGENGAWVEAGNGVYGDKGVCTPGYASRTLRQANERL